MIAASSASGEGDHVSAGEGGSPGDDPLVVDAGQRSGELQRRAPVGMLGLDIQHLTGLAVAVPEPSVVEGDDGVAGRRETLGVSIEPQRAHGTESVRHHDHRKRAITIDCWAVNPCSATYPAGRK